MIIPDSRFERGNTVVFSGDSVRTRNKCGKIRSKKWIKSRGMWKYRVAVKDTPTSTKYLTFSFYENEMLPYYTEEKQEDLFHIGESVVITGKNLRTCGSYGTIHKKLETGQYVIKIPRTTGHLYSYAALYPRSFELLSETAAISSVETMDYNTYVSLGTSDMASVDKWPKIALLFDSVDFSSSGLDSYQITINRMVELCSSGAFVAVSVESLENLTNILAQRYLDGSDATTQVAYLGGKIYKSEFSVSINEIT